MAVEFRNVHCPPLDGFSASAPDSCVIGVIGERGSGKGALLKLAAGVETCEVGEVIAPGTRRYIGPSTSSGYPWTGYKLSGYTLR